MNPEFEIFTLLQRHDVPFVIIGGHAVNVHGYRRVTEDTDVIWARSPETERSLAAALSELEAKYIGEEIDPATGIEKAYPVSPAFIQSMHLMMLWTNRGFLDLFDYIPGAPEEDVRQLFDTSIEGEGLRFASLAWLRKMKKLSGRTKDLLDLENLPEE